MTYLSTIIKIVLIKNFFKIRNGLAMYCKHCGKKIEDDSKFCRYCGKVLSDSKEYSVKISFSAENVDIKKKTKEACDKIQNKMSFFSKQIKPLLNALKKILIGILFFVGLVWESSLISAVITLIPIMFLYENNPDVDIDKIVFGLNLTIGIIFSAFYTYRLYKKEKEENDFNVIFNNAFKRMLLLSKYTEKDFKGINENLAFELKKSKIIECIYESYDSWEEVISDMISKYEDTISPYDISYPKIGEYKKLSNPKSETFIKMVQDPKFQMAVIIEFGKDFKQVPFYRRILIIDRLIYYFERKNVQIKSLMTDTHRNIKILITNYLCSEYENYEKKQMEDIESYKSPNWPLILRNMNKGFVPQFNYIPVKSAYALYFPDLVKEFVYLDKIINVYGSDLTEDEANQEMESLVYLYSKDN